MENAFSDPVPADALLTSKQIKSLVGDPSDMTLWRWIRDKKFPAPARKFNGRRFWRAGDVRQWMVEGETSEAA